MEKTEIESEANKMSLPTAVKKDGTLVLPGEQKTSFAFKAYVIITMTCVWSGYSLTIRYTRTLKDVAMYHSTTVVVMSELFKCTMACVLLLWSNNWMFSKAKSEFQNDILGKPKDMLKMSVPSIVYAIQNNLDFVALQNLDAGVYQVTIQLKVVTTAIFMVIMLGRKFSLTRWISIFLLFGGVALVQLDATQSSTTAKSAPTEQNYMLGIGAVLVTCLTAGFAGVYFEKMLKNSTTSLWIRNIQMYFCGIISALIGCFLKDGSKVYDTGFFYGYYSLVWLIVAFLSVGGIYISMVMKYLDNQQKSFASAVSISLVAMLSWQLFGSVLGMYFMLGTGIVIGSVLLYNYVSE